MMGTWPPETCRE